MRLRENSRLASAVATFLPRIKPATRPSFCGETRSMRAIAFASFSLSTRAREALPIFEPLACLACCRSWCRRCSRRRCCSARPCLRSGSGAFLLRRTIADCRMGRENPRRRKLAELVADHVLGHVNGNVLLAVVDAEGEADELRQDRRAAAPDLDHFRAARRARGIGFLQEIAVDKRTFP